jgi:hypothetical protein
MPIPGPGARTDGRVYSGGGWGKQGDGGVTKPTPGARRKPAPRKGVGEVSVTIFAVRPGGATTRMRAIMPAFSCSRISQWKTRSLISWNGISTTTVVGRQRPLRKASVEPLQESVTAARGRGRLSCGTSPSAVLLGSVVPGVVPPWSSLKRVWWMWKLWSSSVRLVGLPISVGMSAICLASGIGGNLFTRRIVGVSPGLSCSRTPR